MIARHVSHDLGLFHYGEEARALGLAELEILTYPVHVGGAVFLSDHGHDEEEILNAHAAVWGVVIASVVVSQTQNADSLFGRGNETV